jgi:hypothetical protein
VLVISCNARKLESSRPASWADRCNKRRALETGLPPRPPRPPLPPIVSCSSSSSLGTRGSLYQVSAFHVLPSLFSYFSMHSLMALHLVVVSSKLKKRREGDMRMRDGGMCVIYMREIPTVCTYEYTRTSCGHTFDKYSVLCGTQFISVFWRHSIFRSSARTPRPHNRLPFLQHPDPRQWPQSKLDLDSFFSSMDSGPCCC